MKAYSALLLDIVGLVNYKAYVFFSIKLSMRLHLKIYIS